MKAIKNFIAETAERAGSETSDYFKPIKKIGGYMAAGGIVLKIVASCIPATMPIGIASLAPDLIQIGLTLFGVSALTKKK